MELYGSTLHLWRQKNPKQNETKRESLQKSESFPISYEHMLKLCNLIPAFVEHVIVLLAVEGKKSFQSVRRYSFIW